MLSWISILALGISVLTRASRRRTLAPTSLITTNPSPAMLPRTTMPQLRRRSGPKRRLVIFSLCPMATLEPAAQNWFGR
jgi:hypothetical protein